jgi:hypothetical protein
MFFLCLIKFIKLNYNFYPYYCIQFKIMSINNINLHILFEYKIK